MTAHIAVHGRLVVDVQSKTINNGNMMAYTRLAVSLPCREAENGELTFWLAVTTFGKQADYLLKHKKGDLISVSGAMQASQWKGNNGAIQTGYQMVADSVISSKTVRPGGRRKNAGGPSAPDDDYSDEIPF
ncbi:single-stranded DNA-binding protein [Klebsiella aerogenes]|uniref:Single-stranded DNA-binding protein n=1 Tax=Klebsiella aerogenes TaxID=548 RepID=A0AAP9QWI5_KLEAE|nr:single-stranded DNA-binding protein [Klebsiella aerogenes]QMR40321.1 single-stranded DNA-binding protein [Klebsiella aerogenes]